MKFRFKRKGNSAAAGLLFVLMLVSVWWLVQWSLPAQIATTLFYYRTSYSGADQSALFTALILGR